MPFSNGAWDFGSNVSVWAIPPAIQSSTTESAVEGMLTGEAHEDKKPRLGIVVAIAAELAAAMSRRNSLRVLVYRLFLFRSNIKINISIGIRVRARPPKVDL